MDVSQAYHDDHFTMYTNNESLCGTTKTNTTLFTHYTSIKIFLNKYFLKFKKLNTLVLYTNT